MDVTKPRLSVETEPVMKLLIQGKGEPVPMELMTGTAKKGMRLLKNTRLAKEVVIR